jgi:hypothetical protein
LLSLAALAAPASQATEAISVLLERNPPNWLLAWADSSALGRESNSAPQKNRNNMPSKTTTSATPAKNPAGAKAPVQTLRLGRIKAAIWENEADQKKFYNVTFSRTYIDEAQQFHNTDSFGRDDLPLVAKLADQAHTFIFNLKSEQKTQPVG